MAKLYPRLLCALLAALCNVAAARDFDARFAPPAGKTLLIIGQELGSVADYVHACKACPTPAGVTTYLGFYDLLSARDGFGGLGQDASGRAAADADWGAGKTSAAKMLARYPHTALVIGLDISNGRRSGGLAEISRGLHEDKIERLAKFFIAAKRPAFLRLGYEFDGMWNQGYEAREAYIAAYRHIVDGLRARHATNVAFVWQASASPLDDILELGRRENIRDWYPGADYVDWVALSWFLPPQSKPRVSTVTIPTQLDLAQEVLDLARAERKPVMIAESAPQGYDLAALTRANISPVWDGPAHGDIVVRTPEQIWSEWYAPLFSLIEANRDLIGAFAYINAHWDVQPMWATPYASGYWGDSRIQANKFIEKKWLAEIRRPVWQHGGAQLFGILNTPENRP